MVVTIYIPTNNVGGFPFLHTLTSIYFLETFFLRDIVLKYFVCLFGCPGLSCGIQDVRSLLQHVGPSGAAQGSVLVCLCVSDCECSGSLLCTGFL